MRPDKLSIIGNGVVVDPWALLKEIDAIAEKGVDVTPENLKLADNATLILPSHGQIDRAREEAAAREQDRHHRPRHRPGLRGQGRPPRHPRLRPRRAGERSAHKIETLLVHHNALLRGLGAPEVEPRRSCKR